MEEGELFSPTRRHQTLAQVANNEIKGQIKGVGEYGKKSSNTRIDYEIVASGGVSLTAPNLLMYLSIVPSQVTFF